MNSADILIIGAGICGITLARSTKKKCIVLEKSRGLGGRLATRRIDNLGFDHGALFLNESDCLNNLLQATGFDVKKGKGLYIDGGMTQIPKKLSENVDIRKGVRAKRIERRISEWVVHSEENEVFTAEKLIITAPLPQALDLLNENRIPYPGDLRRIKYTKAVMALVVTSKPFVIPDALPEHIESIALMKDRNLHPNGLVIRATPEYSEEVFELSDEHNLKSLIETLSRISPTSQVTHAEFKKWRYVLPKTSYEAPFLEVSLDLYLAGDAFSCPDVNGSLASAASLAAKL